MSNTYTQIQIQAVFSVKSRDALINPLWEERLHSYIHGVLKEEGHKPLKINGTEDHLHVFFGLNPNQSLSLCMQKIKGKSSKWINAEGLCKGAFAWQRGYGAFSYSRSQFDAVYLYIANQKDHHKKMTFLQEFESFLKKFEIPYDPQYLPKDVSSEED